MEVSTPEIYAFCLLHEQSIASSRFVDVTTQCPLLLCLIGDQSVRQRATASLLCAVHFSVAAAAESPFLLASVPSLLLAGVLRASARRLPHSRATSWALELSSAASASPASRHPCCWSAVAGAVLLVLADPLSPRLSPSLSLSLSLNLTISRGLNPDHEDPTYDPKMARGTS
ncbi:hypothetical protein Scep_019613 [Stephania cephalantha]|uniref:Uncharacterized protein n=1 Tax=Stephania cephalantha TaxID=152367 RepID=A0AAP0IB38_9MAGN